MSNRLLFLLALPQICCFTLGCSSLGFATYPVAHMMTRQTKDVLESTPKMPTVARELAKEVSPVHTLQPGDEVLIEAASGDSDLRLPADQQVASDGSLDLGKFGRVAVAAMTLEQAEASIQQSLLSSAENDVAVNVRLIQPIQRFYVIGEVNSPGYYSLTGFETVLDGIMAAGGLTSRASACDMLLARPTDPYSCRVTLPVCYRAITQLGDTTTNYQLKAGDRIFVGRQSMIEELFSCCSQKNCPRCCGEQTACCDPRLAERMDPEFILPATPMTLPVDGLSSSASEETVPGENMEWDVTGLPDVMVESWNSEPSSSSDQSAALQSPPIHRAEPQSVDPDSADHVLMDGELDFVSDPQGN